MQVYHAFCVVSIWPPVAAVNIHCFLFHVIDGLRGGYRRVTRIGIPRGAQMLVHLLCHERESLCGTASRAALKVSVGEKLFSIMNRACVQGWNLPRYDGDDDIQWNGEKWSRPQQRAWHRGPVGGPEAGRHHLLAQNDSKRHIAETIKMRWRPAREAH